jgi:hypothetical protein
MQLMQARGENRDLTNDVTHKAQVDDWLDAADGERRMMRPQSWIGLFIYSSWPASDVDLKFDAEESFYMN